MRTPSNKRERTSTPAPAELLDPSPMVRRLFSKVVSAAAKKPIIDVACGSGRNAIPFLQVGCDVICVDKNLDWLRSASQWLFAQLRIPSRRLILKEMDLINEKWPFPSSCAGGIINVHFFRPDLLRHFAKSLSPGGYLLLETPPGCGGNYTELPKAGELKAVLSPIFELAFYKERAVGPRNQKAVSVQVFARRQG